jgi:hypothetical protein
MSTKTAKKTKAAKTADPAKSRRRLRILLAAAGIVLVAAFAGSDILLLFSPARPVVAGLDHDVVWVEPGAGTVDLAGMRVAIGDRPLAFVVVKADSPLAKDKSGTCDTVVKHIDGLMVAIVAGGTFAYGCESDDLPLNSDRFGWDFVTWERFDSATQFLGGDLRAQAQQLAAHYDSDVASGTLTRQPRTFHSPGYRYLLAGALALVVILAVLFLRTALARLAAKVARARAERAQWRDKRADLDAHLGEVALVMVDLPANPADSARTRKLGMLSRDYLAAMSDWEAARPGAPLDDLATRVRSLRQRAIALERA